MRRLSPNCRPTAALLPCRTIQSTLLCALEGSGHHHTPAAALPHPVQPVGAGSGNIVFTWPSTHAILGTVRLLLPPPLRGRFLKLQLSHWAEEIFFIVSFVQLTITGRLIYDLLIYLLISSFC